MEALIIQVVIATDRCEMASWHTENMIKILLGGWKIKYKNQ